MRGPFTLTYGFPERRARRSADVGAPQINVDHFYHRPVSHVVGLLSENSEIQGITADLESAGVDVSAVEILCGERGAAILDEYGRYHGLRGRIARAFQRLGYDETTLAIYNEALNHGDLPLQVPDSRSLTQAESGCPPWHVVKARAKSLIERK